MKILFKILIAALGIALLAFFFPKSAGSTCGFCPGFPSIQRTEYECIGFLSESPAYCLDCGMNIMCFGIVTSKKKCYTAVDNRAVEVPGCKNPTTSEEVLSLCPECFSQAAIKAVFPENNLPKAIEICSLAGDKRDNCLLKVLQLSSSSQIKKDGRMICSGVSDEEMGSCTMELVRKLNLNNTNSSD